MPCVKTAHDARPLRKKIVAQESGMLLNVMRDLFPEQQKKQLLSFILCGDVSVNGDTVKHHNQRIRKGDILLVATDVLKYASRGAYKITPVFNAWNTHIAGKVWLDVGSSTGGFTDCLLERGAQLVHAIDVGYNLLSYKLRTHPCVRVHERTNILHVHSLNPKPHCAVVDVSFCSLAKILAHTLTLCEEKYIIALCKPQFEFAYYKKCHAHEDVQDTQNNVENFFGVIYDDELRKKIVLHTIQTLAQKEIFTHKVQAAGIRGRKGNEEFFLEITDTSPQEHANFQCHFL